MSDEAGTIGADGAIEWRDEEGQLDRRGGPLFAGLDPVPLFLIPTT